jgi:glycosyltransferase involved in cell wall biosynthesis
MSSYAPVILFAYNRPQHLERTLQALKDNVLSDQTEVTVFSDGPKNDDAKQKVAEVRALVRGFQGFKALHLVERESNLGLAKNVIGGVTEALAKSGSVIVLEDDMITSPVFLRYMNEGLARYENDERVISIHGFLSPINFDPGKAFFLKGADCWGWATWRRGWALFEANGETLLKQFTSRALRSEFNFENSYDYIGMLEDQIAGRNNSWAIRWYASAFLKGKLTLYPPRALVQNIGMDGSGTHCEENEDYRVELGQALPVFPDTVEVNLDALRAIVAFQRSKRPFFLIRMKRRFQEWFK